MLCVAAATQNFKWVKITQILYQTLANHDD